MDTVESGYLDSLLEPIRRSASYRPRFGQRTPTGLAFEEFHALYASDPFYAWLGLDTEPVYAAHRAAGGITSIYRQIGIGCERLIRKVFRDHFDLTDEEVRWSYAVEAPGARPRVLSLDARIPLDAIGRADRRRRVRDWMRESARRLNVASGVTHSLESAVFEIRQGYKSKDSKRQNADLANAAAAYTQCCLPCLLLLSQQIDEDILWRYGAHRWLVLTGSSDTDDPISSTYGFFRSVVGFDLSGFFERHAVTLRQEIAQVVDLLLHAAPSVSSQNR